MVHSKNKSAMSDMNPYQSTTDTEAQSPPPRGFRRGVIDGWRYSKWCSVILGTTALFYTTSALVFSPRPVTIPSWLAAFLFVLLYYLAVPVVWCCSAGVVAWIQDLHRGNSDRHTSPDGGSLKQE